MYYVIIFTVIKTNLNLLIFKNNHKTKIIVKQV